MLGRTSFPAEGIAESAVIEVVVSPSLFHDLMNGSEPFRQFVLGNYGDLIGGLIMLLDDVMFGRLDIRLAALLIEMARGGATIERTHQELAVELGSAREAISRMLKEFERKRWIDLGRGRIDLLDQAGLRELAAHRDD